MTRRYSGGIVDPKGNWQLHVRPASEARDEARTRHYSARSAAEAAKTVAEATGSLVDALMAWVMEQAVEAARIERLKAEAAYSIALAAYPSSTW